jgi:hypothetical protein
MTPHPTSIGEVPKADWLDAIRSSYCPECGQDPGHQCRLRNDWPERGMKIGEHLPQRYLHYARWERAGRIRHPSKRRVRRHAGGDP